MRIKKFKILNILVALFINLFLCVPSYANESAKVNDVNVINIYADLSEYPEFDINDYTDYIPLIEQCGIDVDDVFAICPYGIPSFQNQDTRDISVPAGILLLTGTYVTPYQWMLTVLNVGVLDVINMEADVRLFNNVIGPIYNRTRVLGGLARGVSFTESFFPIQNQTIDCAVVTVTGITSDGEFFNMGGAHYRE